MGTKLLYAEFVVVYLLTLISCPSPNVIRLLCSKDSAKLVRKLVNLKWNPILDKYKVKLPLECPFHPHRDIFGPQQEAKKRNRPSQWMCRLCGKSFYNEKHLDEHFDSRHNTLINNAEDAVCLGDFCDIMRCDVLKSQQANILDGSDGYTITDLELWRGSNAIHHSRLHQIQRTITKTLSLERKKGAKFPWKDNNAHPKRNEIQPRFGDLCPNVESTLNGNAKESCRFGKADQVRPLSYDENTSHISSAEKTERNILLQIQKAKARCQPEKLSNIKTKCETLIRGCILGLLLEMSDQSFIEMEDELNRSVCWYLTCDRYWEDNSTDSQLFPWGLILIFTFILSLGVCFCYYIIWILFDSEESTGSFYNIASRSAILMADKATAGTKKTVLGRSVEEQGGGAQNFGEGFTNQETPEFNHSEHYIYVTYPPDLKRRLLERTD